MKTCPLGHTCDSCLWQAHVVGTSPQNGDPVDTIACAVALLPMLLIEGSKAGRETVAQVSGFAELAKQVVKSQALNRPTPELMRIVGVADG